MNWCGRSLRLERLEARLLIVTDIPIYIFVSVLTGKSLLETFVLASTNPHNDKRLFIDLTVQYMKTTSSEHVVYIGKLFFVLF